jgi:hypothetical protein
MGEIDVYLTTTKWTQVQKMNDIQIATMDVPVCVAKIVMLMFGFNFHEKEESEHKWSDVCKLMAQYVIIDPTKRFLYIGDDKNAKSGTALVEFQSPVSEYSTHFFKRWVETKSLLFEFTVMDANQQSLFCIRGLWVNNSWQTLDVVPTNNLTIIDTKDTTCKSN